MVFQCWWGIWTFEDKVLGPGTTPLIFFWYLLIGYGFSSVAYALQFTVTKDIPSLPQKFWSEFVVAVGVVGVVSLVSHLILPHHKPIRSQQLRLMLTQR